MCCDVLLLLVLVPLLVLLLLLLCIDDDDDDGGEIGFLIHSPLIYSHIYTILMMGKALYISSSSSR